MHKHGCQISRESSLQDRKAALVDGSGVYCGLSLNPPLCEDNIANEELEDNQVKPSICYREMSLMDACMEIEILRTEVDHLYELIKKTGGKT